MDTSPEPRTRIRGEAGFGLTELVIAIAVLTVGLLVVFTVIETAIAATTRAGVKTTASAMASAEMERIRAMPWTSIGLDEADIAATDSNYRADNAWEPLAADRVDVPACPDTPCTLMVPTRDRVGADNRTYRVDIYVTWRAVAGGDDVKVVSIAVRSPAAPDSSLAELSSSFDDDRPNGGVGPVIPPPGNRAPTLESPGNRHNTHRGNLFLNLDGSDLDGDALTYSATGLPTGLSLDVNTGDITGSPRRPGRRPGFDVYTVVATVTDGQLSDSVTFTWTIYRARGDVNLALSGIATQSSTYLPYIASRANDGNTNGNLGSGSVTATQYTSQPWWDIDLGAVQAIERVRIYNRTDCCGSRLSNFYVLASETPFIGGIPANRDQSVYWEQLSGGVGSVVNVNVNDEARYIRVRLAGRTFLSLAEVEVIAAS